MFYNYNTNTIASFLLTSGRRFCNSSRVSEAQFFLLVPQSGKPTLKNTEDVKKSCMRGSNRSRPISAAGETKGYGCDQRTTTQISEIQHRIIDVDIGNVVESEVGETVIYCMFIRDGDNRNTQFEGKTHGNWEQRECCSAGRGSVGGGGSRPKL